MKEKTDRFVYIQMKNCAHHSLIKKLNGKETGKMLAMNTINKKELS